MYNTLRIRALGSFYTHILALEADLKRPFRDIADLGVAPIVKRLKSAWDAHANESTGKAPRIHRAYEAGQVALKLERCENVHTNIRKLEQLLAERVPA